MDAIETGNHCFAGQGHSHLRQVLAMVGRGKGPSNSIIVGVD